MLPATPAVRHALSRPSCRRSSTAVHRTFSAVAAKLQTTRELAPCATNVASPWVKHRGNDRTTACRVATKAATQHEIWIQWSRPEAGVVL